MAQTVDLGQVVPDVTTYPKYAYDVYTIDKEWEVAFSESSTSVRLQNIYKPNVKIIMFPFLSIVFEMYGIEYNETVSSSNGGLFICYDELNVSNLYVKRATHANEFYWSDNKDKLCSVNIESFKYNDKVYFDWSLAATSAPESIRYLSGTVDKVKITKLHMVTLYSE